MLHAVASMLQKDSRVTDGGVDAPFASWNSLSGCNLDEDDAHMAVLSRIAWKLSGCKPLRKNMMTLEHSMNEGQTLKTESLLLWMS